MPDEVQVAITIELDGEQVYQGTYKDSWPEDGRSLRDRVERAVGQVVADVTHTLDLVGQEAEKAARERFDSIFRAASHAGS